MASPIMIRDSKRQRAKAISEKLREARIAAKLNQTQAAKRLKKPQSFVSRCESGTRRIDFLELEEFARVYGKPLTFFIGANEDAH